MKILTCLVIYGLVLAQRVGYLHINTTCMGSSPVGFYERANKSRISMTSAKTLSSPTSVTRFTNTSITNKYGKFNSVHNRRAYARKKRVSVAQLYWGSFANPAICMPTPQVVEINPYKDDLRFQYIPSCTRVNRCSGCCIHFAMTCKPTQIVLRNFRVKRRDFNKLKDAEEVITVPIEEHVSCGCKCIITPEDCHPKTKYIEEDCQCVCQNKEEENQCRNEYQIKQWNSTTCSCHCREIDICSEYLAFNHDRCKCELTDEYLRSHGMQRQT